MPFGSLAIDSSAKYVQQLASSVHKFPSIYSEYSIPESIIVALGESASRLYIS